MRLASLHRSIVPVRRSPRPNRISPTRRTVRSIGLAATLVCTAGSATACVDGDIPSERPDSLASAATVVEADELEGAVGEEVEGAVILRLEADDGSSVPDVTGCDDPGPGWIWCDDFETDRTASYFEYVDQNGSFTRAAGVGKDGSWGMRARFSEGQVSAGSLKLAFGRTPSDYFDPVDEGTADHQEIYWRVHVRYEENWQGNGADKMSRVTSFANSGWAQSMIGHVWSGRGSNDPYLMLDPASGTDGSGLKTTGYNDFPNLTWLGAEAGDTPLFAAGSRGTWFCIEARVRLDTPGEHDGVFELWIDGGLDARITGLNWRDSYDAFGINAMFLENYWDEGSPRDQERYFDGLVVSTERIGCGG